MAVPLRERVCIGDVKALNYLCSVIFNIKNHGNELHKLGSCVGLRPTNWRMRSQAANEGALRLVEEWGVRVEVTK